MTERPRAAVLLTAALLAVGGCAAGRDAQDGSRPPAPAPMSPTVPTAPGKTLEVLPPPPPVAWAGDGDRLAVTTNGSSSCPLGPTDVAVVGDQQLRVDVAFLFPDREWCTADIAPRTTEIEVPDGISADEPLTVILDGEGGAEERVVLPPAGS